MPARALDTERLEEKNINDDIVITGISGRLPESNSIEEFKKQLFDGVDLITDDERRWPSGIFGLPTRTGKIKNLQYFDATFFGVHAKQANVMDPQLRMLLELTYESMVDAGLNPSEMRGTKTGVFIGVSDSESSEYWEKDPEEINGYGLTGCCRAMFPNRVSYTFDFSGPSYAVDTACSSSLLAFQQAVTAIKTGQCDSAIVGGVNLLLKPMRSLQFQQLGMLSPEGVCKAFDSSGNGYVRSEAAVVVLLQKASSARRVYASVLGAKTNTDGNKEQGITFPSGSMQNKLIREVYDEIGIQPQDVSYVEAHGTGTKVGDPQEVNSIADFFCKNRKDPLLIGSVKSNMGHSEPASGLASLAKIVIAMESGMIPQNLHFKSPNKDIPALNDGRLKVVSKNEPWNGGIIAINSFGFGGANAHIVLKSNPKPKTTWPIGEIPRVVGVSGRTEKAVTNFLNKIEEHKNDEEFLALIDEVHGRNINGHSYRGYAVLKDQTVKEVLQTVGDNRPIAYVFSGMGSQWPGMAKDLMQLEIFKNSIKKCSDALKPHGINLEDIIINGTDATFNNVLNSFISIAAVQVALTDVLKTIGIEPDIIVGHSVGEVGCAYADGTFSIEQTILAAYFRGRAIIETKLPEGAMAAVGNYDLVLSAQEIRALTFGRLVKLSDGGSSVTESTPASSAQDNMVHFDKSLDIMPKNNLIQMNTKETDDKKNPVFVVHPIEGVVSALETLAKNINVPVYGLQCTATTPVNSIADLAIYYIKQIRTVQPKGPYTIIGYSFGACVAIEMGIRLEMGNEKVNLLLVDGSHSYVATHTGKAKNTKIQGNTAAEQSEVLIYFIMQFKEIDQQKALAEMMEMKTWEDRLARAIDILSGATPFSPEDIADAATSFYGKLAAADKYVPSGKFNGKVTLVKAIDNYVQMGEDYGLSEVCTQKVTIEALKGNHRSILSGTSVERIASITNDLVQA